MNLEMLYLISFDVADPYNFFIIFRKYSIYKRTYLIKNRNKLKLTLKISLTSMIYSL